MTILPIRTGLPATLSWLLLLGVLPGCASNKVTPIKPSVLSGFHGKSIVTARRAQPNFTAGTAGKAAFALIGAFAMISAGNAIVRDNDIVDPAGNIAHGLAEDMTQNEGMTLVNSSTTADTSDTAKLAKEFANADLLIDVQTGNWGFVYFPDNWARYRVLYNATVRLIDTHHATVVAEGSCSRVPDQTPDAPTYDQLMQDHATRLKQELAKATDYCIDHFRKDMLKRP